MRHTFRFNNQQDSRKQTSPNFYPLSTETEIYIYYFTAASEMSRQFSESSELSERSKLQRQKAQSRKTFKLRKTRKEVLNVINGPV